MSKLAIDYAMKQRAKKAKANKGVHHASMEDDEQFAGESKAGEHVRNMDLKPVSSREKAIEEHHKVLGELKSMKKADLKGMAHGGIAGAEMEDDKDLGQMPVDMESETSQAEQDLVDRIMMKKSKELSGDARLYSKGGQVANESDLLADELPAEFDDLVLRDDLESTYGDDDNSGDMLGNAQEAEDRKDIVARIMASRRKKDRNPSPA
jgi:hypothetical protein